MRSLRLVAPLLALAACGLDAPQQYLPPDLEFLAIQNAANGGAFADGDIDEPVTLTALVANPLGRTGVTVDWYACLPGTPLQPSPCEDDAVLGAPDTLATHPDALPLGQGNPVTFDPAPFLPALQAAQTQLITTAAANPRLQCTLYVALPVVAVLHDDTGEVTKVAQKYVRIAPSAAQAAFPGTYVLNLNPVVSALETNPSDADACTGGTPLGASLPAGKVTLCARASPESRQEFYLCDASGPPKDPATGALAAPNTVEKLEWQWYVSAGEIAQAGFEGNVRANPIDLTPPSGDFTLWTIVRDGRDGAGWRVTPLTSP